METIAGMKGAGGDTAEYETLLQEGRNWILRLTSGLATEADAAAVQAWRGLSQAHAEAFAEAASLYRALRLAAKEIAAEASPTGARALVTAPPRRAGPNMGRRAFIGAALAATAAVVVVRPPLRLWPSLGELSADYRTATGERRTIALGNNIDIELNTQTSLVIRDGGQEHEFELVAGEAQFAAGSPVAVIAGEGRTEARRATFDIHHRGTSVCVTCIEGDVDVGLARGRVRLTAAQQVIYDEDQLAAVTMIDLAKATAWRSGLLIFESRPLSDVIEEVNRYRPGRIVLANSALGRRVMNGVFHLDRLDGVIAQIRGLGGRITTLPGGIVLVS
jgi:transmembrane sensor